MSDASLCPNCLSTHMRVFFEVLNVPANSCILFANYEDAVNCPRGEIRLGYCANCGFVANTAVDTRLTEYSQRYEETQTYSPTFKRFHQQLADELTDRYGLRDKTILEIGCGKGEFLMLLCAAGRNQGIGFDPSYIPARNSEHGSANVCFVRDFYSADYASHNADLVCCKMTLEHIATTAHFMADIRKAIADDLETAVFFMLPETLRILQDCAFEDIYYEHCSYFTPHSLRFLFVEAGFDVVQTSNVYGGQYLCIHARPRAASQACSIPSNSAELAELARFVAGFPAKFANKKKHWQRLIDQHRKQGDKLVLWGSGSKAAAFLTTLEVEDAVEYVVDVNPNRHGNFMPGSGQKIIAPAALRAYQPDTVLVMNTIYRNEITQNLAAMGLQPHIHTL